MIAVTLGAASCDSVKGGRGMKRGTEGQSERLEGIGVATGTGIREKKMGVWSTDAATMSRTSVSQASTNYLAWG